MVIYLSFHPQSIQHLKVNDSQNLVGSYYRKSVQSYYKKSAGKCYRKFAELAANPPVHSKNREFNTGNEEEGLVKEQDQGFNPYNFG